MLFQLDTDVGIHFVLAVFLFLRSIYSETQCIDLIKGSKEVLKSNFVLLLLVNIHNLFLRFFISNNTKVTFINVKMLKYHQQ